MHVSVLISGFRLPQTLSGLRREMKSVMSQTIHIRTSSQELATIGEHNKLEISQMNKNRYMLSQDQNAIAREDL